MTTYKFDKQEFLSLAFEEYHSNWTSLGIEDLNPDEASSILLFLSNIGSVDEMDLSNILLVKSADGGILKEVYGPCLFRRNDEIIVKTGNLEFPVTQDKLDLKVGKLEGTLSFDSEPVKIKTKDEEGDELEVDYYNATCDFMPKDGSEFEFKVRCNWNALSNPQPSAIRATMRRGESILKYFKPVPVKGENAETLKMPDLGAGEYEVSGIRKITGGQYGDSYVLNLADGRSVWARGNVADILRNGWEMPTSGVPVTLAIANIKQKGEGKFSLDCALRLRGAKKLPQGKPVEQRLLTSATLVPSTYDENSDPLNESEEPDWQSLGFNSENQYNNAWTKFDDLNAQATIRGLGLQIDRSATSLQDLTTAATSLKEQIANDALSIPF